MFLISIEYNLCTKLRSHSSDRRVQVLRFVVGIYTGNGLRFVPIWVGELPHTIETRLLGSGRWPIRAWCEHSLKSSLSRTYSIWLILLTIFPEGVHAVAVELYHRNGKNGRKEWWLVNKNKIMLPIWNDSKQALESQNEWVRFQVHGLYDVWGLCDWTEFCINLWFIPIIINSLSHCYEAAKRQMWFLDEVNHGPLTLLVSCIQFQCVANLECICFQMSVEWSWLLHTICVEKETKFVHCTKSQKKTRLTTVCLCAFVWDKGFTQDRAMGTFNLCIARRPGKFLSFRDTKWWKNDVIFLFQTRTASHSVPHSSVRPAVPVYCVSSAILAAVRNRVQYLLQHTGQSIGVSFPPTGLVSIFLPLVIRNASRRKLHRRSGWGGHSPKFFQNMGFCF